MRICLVGGGKVGFYLAKTLLEHGHQPVVIESDPETAARLANELDISVIHGDGASLSSLKEADVGSCSSIVCVSGKDEVNLVSAQMAKKSFGVKRTIARVNNPKNTQVLKQLGVDIVVSGTYNLARLIEQEVETSAVRHLFDLSGGAASLFDVWVPETFRYNGQTLTDLPVPKGCVIISILRGEDFVVPNGTSRIFVGDHLMLVCTSDALHNLIVDWRIGDK